LKMLTLVSAAAAAPACSPPDAVECARCTCSNASRSSSSVCSLNASRLEQTVAREKHGVLGNNGQRTSQIMQLDLRNIHAIIVYRIYWCIRHYRTIRHIGL
jgi:hypothetical protein